MNFSKKTFWLVTLLSFVLISSFTYGAITQKSIPVVPGQLIRANTTNDIISDITALNAAIDAITAGSDVKIGTLEANKWCTSNGTKINCNNNPPGVENEAIVDGYVSNNGYLTIESDPQVGTITENKWCIGSNDGKVNCNTDAPSAGSSAWGSLTDVPVGFSDGIDNETAYTHPITAGNKHIPAGGAVNQVLKYSADGEAVWGIDSVLDETTVDSYANNNGYLKLDGSGRIGIGTSVTILNTKLNIDTGNIVLSDTYGLGWGGNSTTVPTCGIKGSATDNYVAIKTNGNEALRVIADGKVGIGTETPTEKLHVVGNIIASGNITAAAPTANNHVATKAYVDGVVAAAGGSTIIEVACEWISDYREGSINIGGTTAVPSRSCTPPTCPSGFTSLTTYSEPVSVACSGNTYCYFDSADGNYHPVSVGRSVRLCEKSS